MSYYFLSGNTYQLIGKLFKSMIYLLCISNLQHNVFTTRYIEGLRSRKCTVGIQFCCYFSNESLTKNNSLVYIIKPAILYSFQIIVFSRIGKIFLLKFLFPSEGIWPSAFLCFPGYPIPPFTFNGLILGYFLLTI